MSLRVGLAIFVKTPGHSPLKTRLASVFGSQRASQFHMLAAAAVAAVAVRAQREMPALTPHWAVAEAGALDDPCWASLPKITQGEGDLGARMGCVTDGLLAGFDGALLLGADTPQIETGDIAAAMRELVTRQHVIGLSVDGGFWLFATRVKVPAKAWSDTPWSQADTGAHFCHALGGDASIARLRTLRDADTTEDLPPLLSALDALRDPLPEQIRLADWLRAQPF